MWCVSCLVLAAAFSAAHSLGDPCKPGVYKELINIYRSTGFTTAYPETPLCDDTLEVGWYRFISDAGGEMPEQCIDTMKCVLSNRKLTGTYRIEGKDISLKKCGTIIPVWMNGSHPSEADGTVQRNVCASYDSGDPRLSSCCYQSVSIGVKNCSGYYVYLLHPTPGCPMSYCAGSRAPCPVGQYSPTGFPPGCTKAYPLITRPPRLTGPTINNDTFHFSCEIESADNDPGEVYEIVWTFDGVDAVGIAPVELHGSNRTAVFDGSLLTGHLGKILGCKVRSFYQSDTSSRSPWIESNSYWVGIRVEPTHVIISQANSTQEVTLTSTIPVLCDHEFDCCLMIKLDIDGPLNKVVTPHECKFSLCKDDWDESRHSASTNVPLVASMEQVQDGTSDLLLTFEEIVSITGGPYMFAFYHYQIEQVQIELEKDEPGSCTLVTDPHITGFDLKQPFNLYKVGDYTAYENPSRHFEVQIRTWPCNGGTVTCICGVAIREKNDLIRINGCDRSYYGRSLGSPELEVVTELREGTAIMRSTDGHEIAVYFPSGSELSVQGYSNYGGHMNVHISIPSSDKGQGKGICGTFDGDSTNDFMHRDGTVDNVYTSYGTPEAFTESWRNDHSTSLFRIVPAPLVNETYVPKYCSCDKLQNGTRAINCTAFGHIPDQRLPCVNCVDLIRIPTNTTSRRRSVDDNVYVDQDEIPHPYDPDNFQDFVPANPTWPTSSGITETEATNKCRQTLQGSQLWRQCQGQSDNIMSSIENCKQDILFADNFDSLESITASFTINCRTELAKDPANYVTNSDGDNVLKPEVSTDLCNTICLLHGRCDRGRCVCNSGFTGDSCQLQAGVGPQLSNVRGSSFCDINQRPCRTIYIDANNIELTEQLACKVHDALPDGQASPHFSMEEAQFLSALKIACSIPESGVKTEHSKKTFLIKATIDGTVYSNPVNFTVFDGTCLNCSVNGCLKLPNTCLIDDLCYQNNDLNPSDETRLCNVSNNESQWSLVPTPPSDFPLMGNPTLSGPQSDNSMVCIANTTDTKPTARFRVSWFVNSSPYPFPRELLVPAGSHQAVFRVADLPPSGLFICKMRSYYSDVNILSPYLSSESIDLAIITRP